VAGAVHTEPPAGAAARVVAAGQRLAVVWQARYTEPPGGAAARVVAAGRRLAVVWQAQYTEPSEKTAHVVAAGPRLEPCGRRSTQSLLEELWAASTHHL